MFILDKLGHEKFKDTNDEESYWEEDSAVRALEIDDEKTSNL